MSYSVPRCSSRRARAVLVLALFSTAPVPLFAQGPEDKPVPEDTCILELHLPEEATVKVDGRDYGTKRRLTYRKLQPDKAYQSQALISFPGGGHEEHKLLIEGGRSIHLPSRGPRVKKPEVIARHGHAGVLLYGMLSPDGRRLVTSGSDRRVILWDVASGRKLRTYRGHTGVVIDVDFNRDGSQIVTTSLDRRIIFWDVTTGRRLRTFVSTARANPCAALSHDDRHLLVNSRDGGAVLHDVGSGKALRTFRGHSDEVTAVAFSPDGRRILTGSEDKKAILWDAATGRQLKTFSGHQRPLRSVVFAPDGRRIVTVTFMGDELILWDTTTGKKLRDLETPLLLTEEICSDLVAFSPDGRTILIGSEVGGAGLYDLQSGKRLQTFAGPPEFNSPSSMTDEQVMEFCSKMQENQACVTSVQFTVGGRPVAIGVYVHPREWKLAICAWDVSTGERIQTFPHTMGEVYCAAGSPDGRRLVSTSSRLPDPVSLWDLSVGRQLDRFGTPNWPERAKTVEFVFGGPHTNATGHTGGVASVCFSPFGQHILTGADDGTAVLWDALTRQQVWKFIGHDHRMDLAKSLRRFVSALPYWERGDVQAWLKEMEPNPADDRFGHVSSVALSPDGRYALTGSQDNTAILWDTASGEKIRSFEGHTDEVVSVAFGPSGRRVLTGSLDGTAILWETGSARRVRTFRSPPNSLSVDDPLCGEVRSQIKAEYRFREAARMVAAQMQMFVNQTVPAQCVAFSPDGRRILVTFCNGTARLWDAASGRLVRVLQAPASDNQVLAGKVVMELYQPAAFSSDARKIAIGKSRGPVLVFDADSGVILRRFSGHESAVTSVWFSPDGDRVLSSSRDGTIRVWDVATGRELLRMISFHDGRDWLALSPEGLFDGSAGGREKVMFRIGNELNVVPLDRFFQDFYYPGLLAAIWRGERPLPKVEIGESLPPRVRIVKPQRAAAVENHMVTLEVEVTDQGGGVRGPWLVQNDARVLAPERTEREEKTVKRTFEIALVGGDNQLEFHAASADGSWESEPAVITLRYERPLPKPELYLVSVGINRYAEKSMNLGLAAGDAKTMAGLFRQRGPALYKEVYTTTLLDEEATAPAILQSLHDLAQQARPQDTVAVFLAGHGTVVGRQYYFLPHEFRRQTDSLEEDVHRRGLSAGRIQEALVTIPALKRIVVFDTGQSGGKMGLARTARDPFAFRGAIERLSRSSGAFMIAAAAVSDKAQEVPDLGHGVLTYTLLAGLHAADGGPLEDQWIQPTGKDRVADVLDWFGFASSHVPRLTKQYFGRQQEVQHSSSGTSFPVLPVPASDKPARIALTDDSAPKARPKPTSAVEGSGQAKLYLVAVGINQYREEAMNLKFACDDAKAMVELFGNRGRRQYRKVSTAEVLDHQATKQGILDSLEKVAGQAQPEDTLVVFLSGHGKMVGQRYYLIPHDFHRQEDSMEEDIRRQGVAADVLADVVSKVPARKRILIFDTCASGGALKISRQGEGPFGFRGAIEKLGQRQGVFTIAASAAGQEAQEIEQLGHGVLTYALLAGLRAVPPGGPLEGLAVGPNGPEGTVDVLDWFSFASGHVPRLTKRYLRRRQHVQISGQGTSFSVLPPNG